MEKTKISVHDLNLYYGENHALKNVSMDIKVMAIFMDNQDNLVNMEVK